MLELQGKSVLVTRPREDFLAFARLLEAQGAHPVAFPTIDIKPAAETDLVRSTLQKLHSFDWLILTSVNAVKVLGDHITNAEMPRSLKLAAVGPKTANALQRRGWKVDFVPDKHVAEAILPGLGNISGQNVLLTRGDLSRPDLLDGIRAGGGQVIDLVVYRTLPASLAEDGLQQIRRGTDVLTFTSSSAVNNFVALMHLAHLDPGNLPGSPIYAHIGPVTASTAEDYKLPTDVVAEIHTLEGMIDSLCHFYALKRVKTQ